MVLIHPDDLNAVVAIGNIKNEWLGTGFFYASAHKDGGLPFLVTNKHIIENLVDDQKILRMKFISYENDTVYHVDYDLFKEDGTPTFYCHPDKYKDIAVCPIHHQQMLEMGMKFLGPNISCNISKMIEIGVSEGDPVFVPGFPMGNIPINKESVIVRKGSIARIQDVFHRKQHCFLLDSFIFPGNSGSPVFSQPYMNAIRGTKNINQTWLLGIVQGFLPYVDEAKSAQTGKTRVIFTENSGLALVHPMDYVEEVINIYKKHFSP